MISDTKPAVCVVGLGYIGLPTAAIIARGGCPVLGLDVSQHVVDTINRGEIHIEEVDLDGLVHGVVQRGLLRASTRIEPCDVYVVAVPTPFAKDDHHTPDISYVLSAATEMLRAALKEEGRWLARFRHVSEGLIKAIADEVAARQTPATYAKAGSFTKPATAAASAMAYNQTI